MKQQIESQQIESQRAESLESLQVGDKVIVPGRFRGLTISRIEHGQITATFKLGGFYTGQEWEFQVTGNTPEWRGEDLVDSKTGKSWAEIEYWKKALDRT